MVLREKRSIRPPEDLIERHALPAPLANAYVGCAEFFSTIRDFRDKIVHGGLDIRLLYATERAFCIQKTFPLIERLGCTRADADDNENITSLLPMIAHVVMRTIGSCNALLRGLASQIALPPPMAPGQRVFIRAPNNRHLLWMLEVATGGSPWWSDGPRRRARAL